MNLLITSITYLLSGVACEECPPEHEEAGEGALRVAQDHPLGLLLQSDPGCAKDC